MRQICQTRNVTNLQDVYRQIEERDQSEGMMLVYGSPGLGKTTATCHLYVQKNGILVTAGPGWTQKSLLKKILFELGIEKNGSNADLLDEASKQLAEHCRPLFIDEADFLVDDRRSLETLRVLHDISGAPVILIGMNSVAGRPGINQRINRYPQLSDRLVAKLEFFPADLADMTKMAERYCSIPLSEEMAKDILSETKGNFRKIRTRLAQVQNFAKRQHLEVVNLSEWQRYTKAQEQRAKELRAVGE